MTEARVQHASLKTNSESPKSTRFVSQGTTAGAVVLPEFAYNPKVTLKAARKNSREKVWITVVLLVSF